jgi:hypothetical protein
MRGEEASMTTRDRDPAGPATHAPRDASGRPLPRGAQGVDRVPDDLVLSPEATVEEAQRLHDAGLPFQAHEDVLHRAGGRLMEGYRQQGRPVHPVEPNHV